MPDLNHKKPLVLEGKKIILLLQGGGALGAYQVGAFRALSERCKPDWVAGISIGAINASVIAGHRDPDAIKELESLWDDILSPGYPPADCSELLKLCKPWLGLTPLASLQPHYAGWLWSAFFGGQPNFFSSRVLNPWENPSVLEWLRKLDREELAFYSTQPLRMTLERHVDFSKLRPGKSPRLSVGATRVADGEVQFFDSQKYPLTPEHVMASGALPPAFPPIDVDGKWFFDGGVSSNTPIEILHDDILKLRDDVLVFLCDMWDRKTSRMPQTFDELLWRQKSIQYGSRKTAAEHVIRQHQDRAALKKITTRLEICQLMRESTDDTDHFCFSDADFLRGTYVALNEQGYRDMTHALDHPDPVPSLDHKYATLYRYGAAHKHRSTDKLVAA
jgi:NTE family protein